MASPKCIDLVLHPSGPSTNGRCFWWKLSRELRDEILKLGYARPSDTPIKIKLKALWKQKHEELAQRLRRGGHNITPPPFIHYVDRFLVNKQYAAVARAAFISTAHFDFEHGHCPLTRYRGCEPCNNFRELTRLTIGFTSLVYSADRIATYLPQLKTLYLTGNYWHFDLLLQSAGGSADIDIVFVALSEAALHKMNWFAKSKRICGLDEVSFLVDTATYNSDQVGKTYQ